MQNNLQIILQVIANFKKKNMLDAAKLAQTIVFTSQGTPFMFAGDEWKEIKRPFHKF